MFYEPTITFLVKHLLKIVNKLDLANQQVYGISIDYIVIYEMLKGRIFTVSRAVAMGGRGGSPRPHRKIEIQKLAFWSKFKSRLFG